MKLIELEKNNERYIINFIGKPKNLIDFLNIVVHSDFVDYNIILKQWSLDAKDLNKFLLKNYDICVFSDEIYPCQSKSLDNIGDTMKLKPYEYQKEAISFILESNNSLLVLPCGAGKTCIGIGAFIEAQKYNLIKPTDKGLIIVKASLKIQWEREIYKFSDLKAKIIKSPSDLSSKIKREVNKNDKKIKEFNKAGDLKKVKELKKINKELNKQISNVFKEQFKPDIDLYIVNYEALLNKEIKTELLRQNFNFIFADEIHMIGSASAKRSKALHQFDAKIKIGATATPITKHPRNLYSIFKFIKPGLFQSSSKFESEFVLTDNWGNERGCKNLSNLRRSIAPYTIVKTKQEISDQLPKLQVFQKYVDLTDQQEEAIMAMSENLEELRQKDRELSKNPNKAVVEEEREKIKTQIFALQTFNMEIADSPLLLDLSDSDFAHKFAIKDKSSPKINLLLDLLDEIFESNEKVAIFSRYATMQEVLINAINKKYPNVGIAVFHGGLSTEQRTIEAYDKFRDDPNYKVLLLSDAGAEGLNLSTCKYMIEMELAESYAKQTQRHGRLERADSIHDNVYVYQLIALNSQDEAQLKNIEKKEGYDIEVIKSQIDNEDTEDNY